MSVLWKKMSLSFVFGPTVMLPLLGTPCQSLLPTHNSYPPPTLHSFFRFQRSFLPSRILPWTTSSKLGCLSPTKEKLALAPVQTTNTAESYCLVYLYSLPSCNMYVHSHIHTFTYTYADYKLLLRQDIASSIFWSTQYKHNIFIEWRHCH